jgi:hypothetical protein
MTRKLIGPMIAIAAIAVLLLAGLIGLSQGISGPAAQGTPSATAPIITLPGASGVGSGSTAATCGQATVPLGAAGHFRILAGTTVTSTGKTVVTGNVGVSPGSAVTGFPPGIVHGAIDKANTAAHNAQAALTTAYNNAKGRTNCPISVAGNIGGKTLTPGLYRSTSSLSISSGTLTLTGKGIFVFQIASSFTVTSGRHVVLAGGAVAGNIFWQVGSSAALGTTSSVYGVILALKSISLATGAVLHGRALARNGGVTMQDDKVSKAAQPPTPPMPVNTAPPMANVARTAELSTRWST